MPEQSEQVVRWGLLSTARINDRLIGPLREAERSELVAVASRSDERARVYARQRDIPCAYGSYAQLLADPDIDAIYVSLPNGLHADWSIQCADAGKHVLCEKPLALSIDQVDRMEQAAQRNGVVIQEAAMMRFHPQTKEVQRLVAGGAIGQVRLLRGIFTYVLDNPKDVRMDPEQGGGSLWDLGSYCVRFMRTVMQEEPDEVTGSGIASDRGVDLSLAAQMRFPSGAHAQFFSSFRAFAHVEGDLLGTEGRMQLTSPWVNHLERDIHVRVIRHDGSPRAGAWDDGMLNQTVDTTTHEKADGYRAEVDSMVSSILDGADPVIPLSDSRQNARVILALLDSARTGRAVRIEG